MRVAVTGGNGKLGRTVVKGLIEQGHDVINFDREGDRHPSFVMVDLTNYGQVLDAIMGVDDRHAGLDAIVHLAAVPAPSVIPDAATFHHNMLTTYNVFQAARRADIKKIVFASSETVLGLPFEIDPPYLPVDEEYAARPESTYSLGKHLEEQMAAQLARWDPDLSIIALRFSNVMNPSDYAKFPSFNSDAHLRRWNLWGYIDGRDGAQAVSKALEYGRPGFEAYIVAAADTVMNLTSANLAAEIFPDVDITRNLGRFETLLSIDKAREVLHFSPEHSWRNHVPPEST